MTRVQCLAELNVRLRAHPGFAIGMRFIPFPIGSTPEQATGFTWVPQAVHEPMQSIVRDFASETTRRRYDA